MHKFKFEPPQEHRRSLHPKNDNVALITTLQKCTQILREDRLWLRNQIKNNRPEILQIFKTYPKPSQLQHLQIKLRKYVQTVKTHVKNEQLNRFKQSLRNNLMSASFLPDPRKTQFKPPAPHPRQPIHKPNSSAQFNKTTNPHSSKFLNQSMSSLNMNRSLHHFHDLLQAKYNQEVIEQRQSENVTSARLGRQETEPSKLKNTKENKFDIADTRKPQNNKQSFKKTQDKFELPHFLKNYSNIDLKQSKLKTDTPDLVSPWQFQKKAKTVLYQYQQPAQIRRDPLQISSQSLNDQKEQSIFDQHFNESNKSNLQLDQPEYPCNTFVNQFKSTNLHFKDILNKPTKVCNQIDPSHVLRSLPSDNLVNPLKQSDFKTTEGQVVVNNQPLPKSFHPRIEQILFTPPQLLNQCRNFLKNRDSSLKKPIGTESDSKLLPEATLSFPIIPQQFGAECLFTRNNIKEESLKIQNMQSLRKQEQEQSYPQINQSNLQKTNPWDDNKSQQSSHHLDSFPNNLNSNLPSPTLPNSFVSALTQKSSAIAHALPQQFSIEDFLEDLLNLTEMSFCIDKQSFLNFITQQQHSKILKQVFSQLLTSKTQLFLTQIATTLNKFINQTSDKTYPHNDQLINSVYDLLDINQKDYIDRDDIESFLQQIEQADVDNYELVCESLWRLFQGADFSNEQKLTYWHLYIVKTSEEFTQVSRLLSEFEFEIERT